MVLARPNQSSPVPPAPVPKIAIQNVHKRFLTPSGAWYEALGGVSFNIAPGEFVSVVGPSGCGKSTLLRIVAGLAPADQGEVQIDGKRVYGVDRRLGFVFQLDALLPWRTVFDNVAMGLRFRGVGRTEVKDRVDEWLTRVGLRGFEDYFPARLSGGMRKRAAIAQTLVYEPEIILMDEPFAHLDVQTRFFIEEDLMNLCADGERTIMFVTHDLDEAISLSDRVVILTSGPRSTVRGDQKVEIPRPRSLVSVRGTPGYAELSSHLWRELFEEVSGTYGRYQI